MSTFRLIQVSDSHLSRERPFFVANWDAVVAYVDAAAPDLVVNTGDLSLNGPDVEDDLAFAAEQHARFACPVRVIPGNHDLGDNPAEPGLRPVQPVTEARRAAYRRQLGDEYWAIDAGAWRLIGLNAQLFETGLNAEAAQWSFLTQAFAAAGGRPVAVFLHKPMFKTDPGETDEARHRYVPPASRHRLMALMETALVKLVACGHVHQHRVVRHGGIDHVWCPSTACILPDDLQPRIGEKAVGLVEYVLDDDQVTFRFARPDGMRDTLVTDVPAYDGLREKMQPHGAAAKSG